MSCKSALYAINNSVVSLPDGGTYAPATIVRRYGQNYQLQGNGITLTGPGYYDIAAGASSPAFHYKKLKSSTQTTTDSGRAVSIFSRWPKISTAEESAGGSTPENRHGKNPDGHWSV